MNTKDIIQELEQLLKNFDKKYSTQLKQISSDGEKMKKACEKVEESWTGSCIGYHAKLYYGDFEKPPRDESFSIEWGGINGYSNRWQERTPDEVKEKIQKIVKDNFSVDEFEKRIKKRSSEIEDFQSRVEIIISSLTSKQTNHPFSSIEKIEPNKKLKTYIKNYTNRQWMSRDTEAFSQGIIIPAIIYYEAVVYEAESLVNNSDKFLKAVSHFIKWYELQNKSLQTSNNKITLTDLSLLHQSIFSKCQGLFESGKYTEAVEKSFKIVRDKLRDLTGYETGSEAFGKGKLHIKGAAAPNVDTDFNAGVKFLTMAIDMFRNEKSHTSNAEIDDPQKAYEYLTLSSLAMHLLDRGEIIKQ